jgi:hypothetical protein
MENVIAETHIRTSMQVSIEKILSEKGGIDLFYNNCVTGFYLIIDQTINRGIRLIIERMENEISVIYDFRHSSIIAFGLKQHHDIEMIFCSRSWEPLSLEHYHFNKFPNPRTIQNYNSSPPPKIHQQQIIEHSRIWAKHIRRQEWEKASKYEFGYKIEGKWYRSRIRER